MTLAQIHARTGLSLAQLRYVLDNELVAGIQEASSGRGTARDFRPGVALLVALAAALLDNHLRAPFVARVVSLLSQQKSLLALERPPQADRELILELAALSYVRVPHPDGASDRPERRWVDLHTRAPLDATYRPVVYVTIDFGQLRRQILGP